MKISVDAGRLAVHAGGQVRLSGGIPVLENGVRISGEASLRGQSARFPADGHTVVVEALPAAGSELVTFILSPGGAQSPSGNDFIGLQFSSIAGYSTGVSLWRYAPYSCWTKPGRVGAPSDLEEEDIQFFYWQHADGVYGAAMPLCGSGFRSTLGRIGASFGVKARSFAEGVEATGIPLLTVGWGSDPYSLFRDLYAEGMQRMGLPENLRERKAFPPAFEYLGACTWNASDTGRLLRDDFLLEFAGSLADRGIPIGWLLVDDGWMDHTDRRLNAFAPSRTLFPRGFKPVVRELRKRFGIRDVGVWYTTNAYWNGINPDSSLGREYRSSLYTWKQRERQDMPASRMVTHWFVSPEGDGLRRFYEVWNRFFREEGFTMIKVDNQCVTERLTAGRFPLDTLSAAVHDQINAAAVNAFAGALINCMAMTAEAYFHFGGTAVARTSEDYFEYDPAEGYDLRRGNAAAHVMQAVYNALYFSQMVYTDFDMFQTHNPNAGFHALARALSGGPVYISDRIGEEQPEVLRPLHYADGLLIRTDTSLLPTHDCLFQVQDPAVFKAFSRCGDAGLVALFNCADADTVTGTFSPTDAEGVEGDEFAVYDHFGRTLRIMRRGESIPVQLGRMGYGLYVVVPLKNGAALIGLTDKYNAPGTVQERRITPDSLKAVVREGGTFAAAVRARPKHVRVDGKDVSSVLFGPLLTTVIPGAGEVGRHTIEIVL